MMQRHLTASSFERAIGDRIVAIELGPEFRLNWGVYPPNKGVKGDEGMFGETVEIDGSVAEPAKFLDKQSDHLAGVSAKLTNMLPSVTKVLFNITQTGINNPW